MPSYEEWKEKYYTQEEVDLKEEFTEDELNLIKKLGIEILDKLYTENEFEVFSFKVMAFYDEDEEKQKETLDSMGIDYKEYTKLLYKINEINIKHEF